ncbi:MAG: hypothetical protein COV75_07180 [Candidatus Omnitrophica bacterium CG11_big_fil_rev_8_21_14_0_20_63_9]|nr:MAG: hypothetical protein COV75_07180 [Candidatus Omnitrophica bacterium CG11_big_fil_rev_8_21_14_0_20_63_9]
MAGPKPTPEEKLFAVIQGAKHPPIRGARALTLAQAARHLVGLAGPLDLPRVNQLLGIVVLGLGIACVAQMFFWPSPERLLQRMEAAAPPAVATPLDGLRATEDYLQTMAQQDPFRVGETPVTATSVESTPKRDPQQVVAQLKLVGIAWGEEPVAMLEQANQTYVVRPGEMIGEAKLKEIFPDHIVLEVDGQSVELF